MLIRKLAKEYTEDAFNTVVHLMLGAEKEGTRLEAAKTVLKLAGVSFDSELSEQTAQEIAKNLTPTARSELDRILPKPEAPLN